MLLDCFCEKQSKARLLCTWADCKIFLASLPGCKASHPLKVLAWHVMCSGCRQTINSAWLHAKPVLEVAGAEKQEAAALGGAGDEAPGWAEPRPPLLEGRWKAFHSWLSPEAAFCLMKSRRAEQNVDLRVYLCQSPMPKKPVGVGESLFFVKMFAVPVLLLFVGLKIVFSMLGKCCS